MTVTMPFPSLADGAVMTWRFEGIEVKRRDFDCQLSLTIEATIPGYEDSFPPTHFSGVSSSGRDTFRRLLDGFYGKDMEWARLLPKAYTLAREAYLQAAQTIDLGDVSLNWEDAWHVERFWPADGVTILYGQGSSGKGHLTLGMTRCLIGSSPFLSRQGKFGNGVYLDYEATERVLARRFNRHLMGDEGTQGTVYRMPGRGIAVADQTEAIARELKRRYAGWLVVDSAIPALGGDPLKSEVVGRMFNSLNQLHVPVWLLAHVTKSDDRRAEDYPFGSVFFHNLARMTWLVKKVGDDSRPDIEVGIYNKKANEGRELPAFGASIRFDDPYGPISIHPYDAASDGTLNKSMSLGRRIWSALASPKLTSQLAEELEKEPNEIRTAAGRRRDLVSIRIPGEREVTWSRIAKQDEQEQQ